MSIDKKEIEIKVLDSLDELRPFFHADGGDMEFVDGEMVRNRYYSVNHRQEILDYAKTFDWLKVIDKYYVPAMEKIISK